MSALPMAEPVFHYIQWGAAVNPSICNFDIFKCDDHGAMNDLDIQDGLRMALPSLNVENWRLQKIAAVLGVQMSRTSHIEEFIDITYCYLMNNYRLHLTKR